MPSTVLNDKSVISVKELSFNADNYMDVKSIVEMNLINAAEVNITCTVIRTAICHVCLFKSVSTWLMLGDFRSSLVSLSLRSLSHSLRFLILSSLTLLLSMLLTISTHLTLLVIPHYIYCLPSIVSCELLAGIN